MPELNQFHLSTKAAENYECQSVPAIFTPMAEATLSTISLPRRAHVLDVACGDQVLRYVSHYRSVGKSVGGWIVAHEVPDHVAEYANTQDVKTTAVPISRCEQLISKTNLSEATLSGVRIQAGVVKGGGAMRFGKNEISLDDALLDMDEECAAFFQEIKTWAGIEIISGAMQSTIIYKGIKIGGLRRKNPVFYILSGLVTDQETEAAILNHGFRKMEKQSKNDNHQHIWYESKVSNLEAMKSVCTDQFRRIDRISTPTVQ